MLCSDATGASHSPGKEAPPPPPPLEETENKRSIPIVSPRVNQAAFLPHLTTRLPAHDPFEPFPRLPLSS